MKLNGFKNYTCGIEVGYVIVVVRCVGSMVLNLEM